MFSKEYLENGIPVVMESFKNIRSVSLGIWIKVGSRYEPPDKNGISHFLEHMYFKATKRRTAKDIAIDNDTIGADLNAYTSRENTTFYIKVIDEYLEQGIDLISDIFLNSVFPEEELEKEKKVILEELKMVEDSPEDYIFDLFNQSVWGNDSLGQSIIGRRESITSFCREDLLQHIRKYYGVKDIVISCAGNFVPEKLVELLNSHLRTLQRGSEARIGKSPVFRQSIKAFSRELLEAHLCVGVPAISQNSKERYALSVLNTILGGGFSSRLFQNIRETKGLAYSIYSFTSLYLDTGLWGVYAGVSKEKVREVTKIIIDEMLNLNDTLSTNNRMNNIARQQLYFGRYISPSEIIKSIDSVSMEQVRHLADRLAQRDSFSIIAYGDLNKDILNDVL
jgi:predicted Zn-dependent peptidase